MTLLHSLTSTFGVHGHVAYRLTGRETLEELTRLQGDYVLYREEGDEVTLVSSAYSVLPYYYAEKDGRLYHGPTVLGVVRGSGLRFAWDFEAISDTFETYHTLGNRTAHPRVKRVPPRSIVTYRGGRLTIDQLPWDELTRRGHEGDSFEAFEKAVAAETMGDDLVSMSAGFDSRVILGAMLKTGSRPDLLTMGNDDSTDVVVSKRIAQDLGLRLEVVSVHAEDYWRFAEKIVGLTGGTKSADNWHTFLYCQASTYDQDRPIFMGSNGEFARAYYVGKGQVLLAALAGSASPRAALKLFWDRKRNQGYRLLASAMTDPFYDSAFGAGRVLRDEKFLEMSGRSVWRGLDRFYVEQRVRHFIGNGLALISDRFSCRTPFLDHAWVGSVNSLGLRWKVGSNWHREMLARCPGGLLQYPEEGYGPLMRRRESLKSAAFDHRQPSVGYAPNAEVLCDARATATLLDGAEYLDGLFVPQAFRAAIEASVDRLSTKDRIRLVGALLPLVIWGKVARERPEPVTSEVAESLAYLG